MELAVRDVVHGRDIRNREALANPEALAQFKDREPNWQLEGALPTLGDLRAESFLQRDQETRRFIVKTKLLP